MHFLNSKKIETILIIKDIITIYFIYNFGFINSFGSGSNQLVIFSLIAFWIFIKYILGQYENNNKFTFTKFILVLLTTILIFILSNFVYLLINIISDGSALNILVIKFFFYISLKISFLILIFDTLIFFIFKNKLTNNKNWLVLSSLNVFNSLKKFSAESNCHLKLTSIDEVTNEFAKYDYEGLIVDTNINLNKEQIKTISLIKSKGVTIINPLNWCNRYLHRCPSSIITKGDIINLKGIRERNNVQFRIKRLGDIFISILLLLLLSPLLVSITFLINLTEGKPIFYSQIRTGINNKFIKIFKFRTMVVNAEKNGPQWSIKNDPRITKIGKSLRRYRIDELPQLISVIKGDMSLIGPRPERPEIESKLKEKIPYYSIRNSVKPGLSGWAQVNYHYGATLNDSINKLSFDIYYVKNFSIIFDLIILFKTIKIIFQAKGSQPKS